MCRTSLRDRARTILKVMGRYKEAQRNKEKDNVGSPSSLVSWPFGLTIAVSQALRKLPFWFVSSLSARSQEYHNHNYGRSSWDCGRHYQLDWIDKTTHKLLWLLQQLKGRSRRHPTDDCRTCDTSIYTEQLRPSFSTARVSGLRCRRIPVSTSRDEQMARRSRKDVEGLYGKR